MKKIKILKGVVCAGLSLAAGKTYEVENKDARHLILKGKATDLDAPATDESPANDNSLDGMTAKELKTYAAEHDIDLEGAKNKTEVRAAIDAHEAEAE